MRGGQGARWADDTTPPRDHVDEEWEQLAAERDHFRAAVLAWLLTLLAIAGAAWLFLAADVGEAAGAWLTLGGLFVVIVALVAIATRRGGPR